MLHRPGPRRSARTGRAALLVLLVVTMATGCDRGSASSAGPVGPASGATTLAALPATGTPSPSTTAIPSATPSATPSGSPSASLAAGVSAADREAGVLSTRFPQSGSGRLVPVKGSEPAPGKGTVVKIRVEVEPGLPVDPEDFAAFVMATLNDPRSWGHGGRMTFARTDGAARIRVVLASPDTSARICRPLQTFGRLSCHSGDAAVLTEYRWVKAIPEYGSDRTGYRHYVVNHEVGHALGHSHEFCAGRGKVAPVMMQQTKGLKGCLPNSWPFP